LRSEPWNFRLVILLVSIQEGLTLGVKLSFSSLLTILALIEGSFCRCGFRFVQPFPHANRGIST
jgi:hypothetical protein